MNGLSDNGYVYHPSPVYKSVLIPLICITTAYYIATFSIFTYRAKVLHDQALVQRSVFLLLCQTLCAILYSCSALIHGAVNNYPCFLDIWLGSFSYALWMFIFILYMLRYYVFIRSHEAISLQTRINPVTIDNIIDHLAQLRQASNQVFWGDTRRPSGSSRNRQRRESTLSLLMGHIMPKSFNRSPEPIEINPQRAGWSKRALSTRFYVSAIIIASVFIIGVLALMTLFNSRLSLKHVHYNCFRGSEFLPLIIAKAVFNIVIGPAYAAIIWKHQDAYGIQRAMMATFVIGLLSWIVAFVWRVNKNWVSHHISATIVYVFQLLFEHTFFSVIPVVKSIQFQKLQKRGLHDTQRMHDVSFLADVGIDGLSAAQTSKQSFLVALQNTNEHQKLERFAKACMCAELMSFLDVYLAFKSCIYHNVISSVAAQEPKNQPQHQNPSNPPIVITESNNVPPAAAAPNRISRLLDHVSINLPTFSQFSSRAIQTPEPDSNYVHDSADLTSIDTGIVETIEHEFPQYGASYATPVPEDLRDKLVAIVKTFILPDSPLEINLSSQIVAQSQAFVAGEPMACGVLDEIKNEVIDMLYSNVYIRYCESHQ